MKKQRRSYGSKTHRVVLHELSPVMRAIDAEWGVTVTPRVLSLVNSSLNAVVTGLEDYRGRLDYRRRVLAYRRQQEQSNVRSE